MDKSQPDIATEIREQIEELYKLTQKSSKQDLIKLTRSFCDWFIVLERRMLDATGHPFTRCRQDAIFQ